MKKGAIVRADGTVLEYEEVGPNRYRLTIQGKPYNIAESLINAVVDGKVKK